MCPLCVIPMHYELLTTYILFHPTSFHNHHIHHRQHASRCLAVGRKIRHDRKRIYVPVCRSQLFASVLPLRCLHTLSGAGRCRFLGARSAWSGFKSGPVVDGSYEVAAHISDVTRYVIFNIYIFNTNIAR